MLNKTKIVATIGPSSQTKDTLAQMIKAGMNVARLNFSHGDQTEKLEKFRLLRELSQDLDTPLAILSDLQGPKLRLGKFEGQKQINKDDLVTLSSSPKADQLPVQFDLSPYLKVGDRIFLVDGLIELKVIELSGQSIKTLAANSGLISSNKGINIPDTSLDIGSFTPKDIEDAKFALENHTDWIALSFVESASDLIPLRKLIQHYNSPAKVLVKIERKKALENLDSIIESADAVMVARGDLGSETSAAEVPLWQQKIIRLARQQQTPVVVATQMLESMIDNPRPTRAETSDVAGAVMIQADAVMLSAESASGKYPVEAVATMHDIILSVEQNPDFRQYIKINWDTLPKNNLALNGIVSAASSLAYRLNSPLIAVATASGQTAQMISSFRPLSQIVAATHDRTTQNQLSLLWGVSPVLVPAGQKVVDAFWHDIQQEILHRHLANTEDQIILVAGSGNLGLPGATDTIRVVTL